MLNYGKISSSSYLNISAVWLEVYRHFVNWIYKQTFITDNFIWGIINGTETGYRHRIDKLFLQ